MGRLTSHVLDTLAGLPAANLRMELFRGKEGEETLVKSARTNVDGRTDPPLLEGEEFQPGNYRLVFHVGDYFRGRGNPDAGRFLDRVPVVFIVSDASQRYHVPLLVSPWSYTTYRGS